MFSDKAREQHREEGGSREKNNEAHMVEILLVDRTGMEIFFLARTTKLRQQLNNVYGRPELLLHVES